VADPPGPRPNEPSHGGAALAAERVAAIVAAAEETAERLRRETEARASERIAEAQRAADNRVQAAEEEADEIVRMAQAEAARLREEGRTEAEAAKTAATSEALAVVARADSSAEQITTEARETAAATRSAAEERARGLLDDARATADGVRSEGLELVANLREMSNSLRSNADRLLGDVQRVHSRLVAQIERVEGAAGGRGAGRPATRRRPREETADSPEPRSSTVTDDGLDVPEFIPPG